MEQGALSALTPLSLSFSGSGFLSLYQIGAVKALLDLAPDILKSAPKVYGASAGSLVAAAVVFKVDLDELKKVILDAAIEARKTRFGPFFSTFNLLTILRNALPNFLPDNAHQVATGRLNVALTRLSDGKTILVSDFKSKEEVVQVDGVLGEKHQRISPLRPLLEEHKLGDVLMAFSQPAHPCGRHLTDALLCSCFIPLYCGVVAPMFQGVGRLTFVPEIALSAICAFRFVIPASNSQSRTCVELATLYSRHQPLNSIISTAKVIKMLRSI